MTTAERLLMQIFDRRRWIEEQIHQQAQSFTQSLALNALADGGTPPSWVLDLVPDAAACPGPKELCREQIISGILNPLPRVCTPSVSRDYPFAQPVIKERAYRPNFSVGMRLSTFFTSDDWDKKRCSEHVSGSHNNGMMKDMDVVDANQDWHAVVNNQLLNVTTNSEYLAGNIGQLADNNELPNAKMNSEYLACTIGPLADNTESENRLRDASECLDGIEPAHDRAAISSGHAYELEQSNNLVYQEIDIVESTSVRERVKQVGKDFSCSMPVSGTNFLDQKCDARVRDVAESSGKCTLEMNATSEFLQTRDYCNAENAQTMHKISEAAVPSHEKTVSNPSKARYFLRSSSSKEKELGSTNSNLLSEYSGKAQDSSFTGKQLDFVYSTPELNLQHPSQVEEDNRVVEDSLPDGNVAGTCTNCVMKFDIFPEFLQCRDSSDAADVQTVGMISEMVAATDTGTSSKPTRPCSQLHYLLRSSAGREKEVGPGRSNSSSVTINSSNGLLEVDPRTCNATWPKRRKKGHHRDTIYGTASKRPAQLEFGDYHSLSISNILGSEVPNASTGSRSKRIIQDESLLVVGTKDYHAPRESIGSSPTHQTLGVADVSLHPNRTSEHRFLDSSCFSEGIVASKSALNSDAALNSDVRLGACYGFSDSLYTENANIEVSNDSMPEYEGFSIGGSVLGGGNITDKSDCLVVTSGKKSADEEPYLSTKTLTPLPNFATKYKIHMLPDCHHSSPGRLFEKFNFSSFHPGLSASEFINSWGDGKITEFLRKELDDPLLDRPKPLGMPSASFSLAHDPKGVFTPFVNTPFQKNTSGRSGRSSGVFSSNPELTCFRIDENASLHGDELVADETDTSSEHLVINSRKSLVEKTSFHGTAPTMVSTSDKFPDRGSLDSVSTEVCLQFQASDKQTVAKLNRSYIKSSTKDKENVSLSAAGSKAHKPVKSVPKRSRSTKSKLSLKVKDQHKVNAAAEKGNKPSNIVSNLSSFIPLLQKQQRDIVPNGKRDIKVKSLEAAEVAKRLEEKKEKERKMKKEAMRLERMRIEQENIKQLQVEQKQKEERRKIETEARKRQREEDGKKERQRKRKCLEETQHQRQLENRSNVEKNDLQSKAMEPKKKETRIEVPQQNLVRTSVAESKKSLKVHEQEVHLDSRDHDTAMISDTVNIIDTSYKKKEAHDGILVMKERRESQSYELSPYRDSDDEEEEENRQKRKIVPLWARRESVDRILDLHKHIDPAEIFSRKNSCSLDEMLSAPIRVRRFPFAAQ